MGYKIEIEGITRRAEYYVDPAQKLLKRTLLEILDERPASGEVLTAYITDEKDGAYQRETWMALTGTAEEIEKSVYEEWPMCRIELRLICEILDAAEPDEKLLITYPISKTDSPVVRNSPMRRMLRSCQQSLVGNIYGRKPEDVKILRYNFS